MSEIKIGDTIYQYILQRDGSVYYPNDEKYFNNIDSLL